MLNKLSLENKFGNKI